MFTLGLVSVTYRKMSCAEVLSAAKDAGLSEIEWGGDVHVPHGDIPTAVAVGAMTRGACLKPVSYGTYYRAGVNADPAAAFAPVLESACALGAPNLRLWAGAKNSEDVTADERRAMVTELRACAKAAEFRGRTISFEYHQNTLTNRADSAVRLIEEIGRANVSLYWQPNQFVSFEQNIENLKTVLPYVSNVHVFAWRGREVFRLAEHEKEWRTYLELLAGSQKDHGLFLEFVPHDDPALLTPEAQTLISWLH